jgi:hypothetical protein
VKFVFALGAAILTWVVVGSIPNMLGNYGGWAVIFVLFIGPGAAFGVFGFVIYQLEEQENAEEQRKKNAEARAAATKADRQRHRQLQKSYRSEMLQLGEQALGVFESMPKELQAAEGQLDQAEIDFAEGVFAPFWDSVERAANSLGRFDEGIRTIGANSTRYAGLIKQYEFEPPGFPLSAHTVARLSTGTRTAERMKAIVRHAQCNFQFATIYEQRKTNQLLVAGFTSLGQALEQMTQRITSSIGDLGDSIESMGSVLNDSMRSMEAATVQHRESLAIQDSQRASREEKAIEMLDNIQRGRKPWP